MLPQNHPGANGTGPMDRNMGIPPNTVEQESAGMIDEIKSFPHGLPNATNATNAYRTKESNIPYQRVHCPVQAPDGQAQEMPHAIGNRSEPIKENYRRQRQPTTTQRFVRAKKISSRLARMGKDRQHEHKEERSLSRTTKSGHQESQDRSSAIPKGPESQDQAHENGDASKSNSKQTIEATLPDLDAGRIFAGGIFHGAINVQYTVHNIGTQNQYQNRNAEGEFTAVPVYQIHGNVHGNIYHTTTSKAPPNVSGPAMCNPPSMGNPPAMANAPAMGNPRATGSSPEMLNHSAMGSSPATGILPSMGNPPVMRNPTAMGNPSTLLPQREFPPNHRPPQQNAYAQYEPLGNQGMISNPQTPQLGQLLPNGGTNMAPNTRVQYQYPGMTARPQALQQGQPIPYCATNAVHNPGPGIVPPQATQAQRAAAQQASLGRQIHAPLLQSSSHPAQHGMTAPQHQHHSVKATRKSSRLQQKKTIPQVHTPDESGTEYSEDSSGESSADEE